MFCQVKLSQWAVSDSDWLLATDGECGLVVNSVFLCACWQPSVKLDRYVQWNYYKISFCVHRKARRREYHIYVSKCFSFDIDVWNMAPLVYTCVVTAAAESPHTNIYTHIYTPTSTFSCLTGCSGAVVPHQSSPTVVKSVPINNINLQLSSHFHHPRSHTGLWVTS